MLILVRHGSTEKNDDEKARGWDNAPLDSHGINQASEAADKLKSIKDIIDEFHSSDLTRTKQTADIISNEIDKPYDTTSKLRTWNIGKLTGQSLKKVRPIMNRLTGTDEKIPEGESYNDFYDRVSPEVKRLVGDESSNHLAVTSSGIIKIADALSDTKGQSPTLSKLKGDGPVKPGGIFVIHPDWTTTILKK